MRAPIIAVDAIGIDQPGGARTAVLCLFRALAELQPDWQLLIFVSQREPALAAFGNVRQIILPARKGWWARVLIQMLMPYIVWRYDVDLVHFTKSQGGLVWGVKVVLTLFDLTTLHHPEIHSPLAVWYWRFGQPLMARFSDAVVTLSLNAARDIQNFYAVPPNKITIVPCAPQFEEAELEKRSALTELNLPPTYLLFVGALALKKNLTTLIEAYNLLRQRRADAPALVLAGPRYTLSDASAIFNQICLLGLEPFVHYLGPVKDAVLPELYRRAQVFLMPSMHEGFGIPCLEAMRCGTPVIASRAASLPEVVGEAGALITDYMSPQAWADGIQAVLDDPARRAELVARGRQRAQTFSWSRSARVLADLYQRLLIYSLMEEPR